MKKIALALAAAAAVSLFATQSMAQPSAAASSPSVNADGKVLGQGQAQDVGTPPKSGTRASRAAERKMNGVAATKSGDTVLGNAPAPETQPKPGVKAPTRAGAHRLNQQGKAVDKKSTVMGEKDAQK
ncbi:MAG: hypothetical protein JWQ11_4651 [Rhizobacter sp.]|nr:hypothetical protein [Rhizobacter sp.]